MIYLILSIVAVIFLSIAGYLNLPKFGRPARGERLARMEQSPNYRNGTFHNREITPQLTSDKGRFRAMLDFLFEKRERNRPEFPIPAIRTDLKALPRNKELLVWFGHSSYLIQSAGQRMLIDPVFADASPVSFFNKPFAGTSVYTAEDMPDIDLLIITHDHWDHLDYETVTALKRRVQRVICPLGVGEHFEYWGYSPEQIVEMDWEESFVPGNTVAIHCFPSRHFSGRTFRSNQTLWASYLIETAAQTIYLSGDGGYGKHFKEIAARFPKIDVAVMENGQYNQDWRYIHLMPEDLKKAVGELNPGKLFTGHNGKYALSKHPWDEPLRNGAALPSVIMPRMGEVVRLNDPAGPVQRWWE